MVYFFGLFEFDPDRFELRSQGMLIALEPQVFLLLKLLIENRDRMVSKDELVAQVWKRRAVSDATIASRIKLARSAIGDDGRSQHMIRTIYGKGFRFVATATTSGPAPAVPVDSATTGAPPAKNMKPSLAVLAFQYLGPPGADATLAEAISHDLIQALSRLRWLTVIARSSTFQFRDPEPDMAAISKTLNVRYLMAGAIERQGQALTVNAVLSDCKSGAVIWSDTISTPLVGVHNLRAELAARVVSSLEVYVPLNEARIARLNVSENLDAWANYHLGLQHMYRFTPEANAKATGFFERSAAQDPGFARAYAGLSFTNFQTAFMKFGNAPEIAALNSRRFAERSIELDPLDPFSNFTMGRSHWLQGDLESGQDWLDRAISLNPNYAQGHYSLGFTDVLACRSESARHHVDAAFLLSPLDQFVYAMLGTRAISLMIDGEYDAASVWADKAARAPGAHFLIAMIAVLMYALSKNKAMADYWSANVRQRRPDANQAHFFSSFPLADQKIRQRVSDAFVQCGF